MPLEQATILIPTCNRPIYLARCLEFYQQQPFQFEIIVLDSSQDNQSADVVALFEGVTYIKYPSSISFSEKLAMGGQLANQPFITVCSDDDFIFAEAIVECVDFLKQHADFSCAHGKYLRHWFDEKGEFRLAETYRGKFANMLDCDISALSRLKFHYADYTPTFYAVTRQAVFCQIYQITADLGVDFGLSEVLPSSLSVVLGKIARLPILYASREAHHHNWVTEERKLQMYSAKRIAAAKACLTSALQQDASIDAGLIKAVLDQLLHIGIGMKAAEFSADELACRQHNSIEYFPKNWVSEPEAQWALGKLAQILLKNQGYSRQDMIKLREALYLTAEAL
jgi:glycosyltransferase domain-containing protein